MSICRSIAMAGTASLLIFTGSSLHSQDWKWPEKPKNLQVLPKDWNGKKLAPVMKGFTRALGVRCNYCHVGEEGKPLSTFDFVSDSNPNKDRAREMYRMLGDINDHLKKIKPSGDKPVNMGCQTCHNGKPRPTTLQEELEEKYRTKGLEEAVSHYANLKKKYFEKGGYDFSERSLNEYGYDLLERKDTTAAIRIFKLNTGQFPDSPNVWDGLAEAYMKSGDLKMAEQLYQKVLTMDSENKNAKEMLKKLKEPGGK